ncbi:MAG: serine protease [Lachnospiraceae bacterium]|nr:serine protease [Lachnospiraceae bacterium]
MDKHKKLTETENLNIVDIDNPELEENLEKQDSVIQEQIKPWHKRKFKKVMSVIGLSLLAGIMFGIAARFVFKYSDGIISKIFGLSVKYDNVQGLPPDGAQPQPTTGNDKSGNPSGDPNSDPFEVKIGQNPSNQGQNPGPSGNGGNNAESYLATVENLNRVSDMVSRCLVTVNSITRVVNWMGDNIEQTDSTVGVAIAETPTELFILTYYDKVSSADRIEIEFRDGAVAEGSLYMADPDSGLAVIEVELTDISASTVATCKYVSLGDSDNVSEGEPVIALGRPNGYYGAVEFGFVSHTGLTKYFIDGVHFGFTTDIVAGSSSDGMVIDLEGKLVGLIVPDAEGERITISAVYINSVKTLLLKLLNGNSLPYFGVRAENVPKDILVGMGLENGIYVNEVIAASPAAEAGVKKGDVIVGIDDIKIESLTDFYEYIFSLEEGSTVRVDIYHSGMRDEPAEEISAVLSVK